jgi:DNA-binding transcriptional LysR family regulator
VLGGKLVNRTAASVTLTELGAAILPHAQRILSVAQAAFSICSRLSRRAATGRCVSVWCRRSVRCCFRCCRRPWLQAFPRLRIEFHDQTNDALIQALQRGEIDFGIGAIDSSLPAELLVYPLREDPFVAVLHRDDPLAAQAHLPWKQLVGRDIAVFSKGNIQRLVAAGGEPSSDAEHPLSGGLYRNPVWPGALASGDGDSAGAVHHPSAGPGAQGRAAAAAGAARTVALMRGPQALPPLIEDCFSLLQAALR